MIEDAEGMAEQEKSETLGVAMGFIPIFQHAITNFDEPKSFQNRDLVDHRKTIVLTNGLSRHKLETLFVSH